MRRRRRKRDRPSSRGAPAAVLGVLEMLDLTGALTARRRTTPEEALARAWADVGRSLQQAIELYDPGVTFTPGLPAGTADGAQGWTTMRRERTSH